MLEEKQLNGQDSTEVNTTNNIESNIPSLDNVPNQTMMEDVSIDQVSAAPVQNAFLYTDTPAQAVVEMPVEQPVSLDIPVQNTVTYTQEPTPVVMPEVQVTPVVPESMVFQATQSTPLEEKSVEDKTVSVNNDTMDKDLKNNLMFMLVFAIIMLVIIIVLPYVSGYN